MPTAFAEIASANRENHALYEIAQSTVKTLGLADSTRLSSARKLSALRAVLDMCAVRAARRRRFALPIRHRNACRYFCPETALIAEGTGLSGWVMPHPKGDRPAERGVRGGGHRGGRHQVLQSALVCPLIVHGEKVIGTIAVFHHDIELLHGGPSPRPLDLGGSPGGFLLVYTALVFERTQEQAFKDALTWLVNPRALQFQVAREAPHARRTSSQFSLLLLDLDDFKTINDVNWHLAGGAIGALQEVARVLKENFTLPHARLHQVSARYEFVVLLSSCGGAEADERRRQLEAAVGKYFAGRRRWAQQSPCA